MIYQNVELLNVSEVEELQDGAFKVYRFPKKVLACFDADENPLFGVVGLLTTGCEIRFVSKEVEITLSGDQDGTVEIWKGDFFVRTVWLNAGEKKTVVLKNEWKVDECEPPKKYAFATRVWRIRFGHDTAITVHSIKATGEIRPPKAEEKPTKTIIAYGSSITHSATSVLFQNSYLGTIGRLLGADVLCKGMGGSCFCQKEVAEYLPTEDWDLAILELGVNMVETVPADEFKRRASEVVRRALTKGKPVVMMSMFTYFSEFDPEIKKKDEAYKKAYREIFEEQKCENLYYVNGNEIVDDWAYLTADLIHPSPYGHTEMGKKIAKKIRDEFKIL